MLTLSPVEINKSNFEGLEPTSFVQLANLWMLSCHLCRQHDPDAAVEGPECSVCRVQESPPSRAQDHSQDPGTKCVSQNPGINCVSQNRGIKCVPQNPGIKCLDCALTCNLPVQRLEAVSNVHYTIILLYFPRFIQLSPKPFHFPTFCRLSCEAGDVLQFCLLVNSFRCPSLVISTFFLVKKFKSQKSFVVRPRSINFIQKFYSTSWPSPFKGPSCRKDSLAWKSFHWIGVTLYYK